MKSKLINYKNQALIALLVSSVIIIAFLAFGALKGIIFDGGLKLTFLLFFIPIIFGIVAFPIAFMILIMLKNKKDTKQNINDDSLRFKTKKEIKAQYKQIYMKRESNVESGIIISTSHDYDKNTSFLNAPLKDNALIVGSKYSGKSSCLLEPYINSFAYTNDKPSLVISDQNGKYHQKTSTELSKMGYQVINLDIENPINFSWNPFQKIWKFYSENKINEISIAKSKLEQLGNLSPSENDINLMVDKLNNHLMKKINNYIDQFLNHLLSIQHTIDSTLSVNSFVIVKWIINAMLISGVNLEHFDPFNIYFNLEHLTYINYVDTSKNIFNEVQNKFDEKEFDNLKHKSLMLISLFKNKIFKHSIDNVELKDSQQAIFINYTKNSNLYKSFISLFVLDSLSWIEKQNEKHKRYFILDNFFDLPAINHFNKYLNNANEYNYHFVLAIQSIMDLKKIYKKEASQLIKNCSLKMLLRASNFEDAQIFSKLVGEKRVVRKDLNNNEVVSKERLLLPNYFLNIPFGSVVIKEKDDNPIKGNFIKFWESNEKKNESLIINNDSFDDVLLNNI